MAEKHGLDFLNTQAFALGQLLLHKSVRVVFAESCTAGLVAAALAATPGISKFLCGSFVAYRESAKTAWLGIEAGMIQRFTAVSQEVTDAMSIQALQHTPEADWSAAVTGHLGPNAPPELDGRAFLAIAQRTDRLVIRSREAILLAAADRVTRQYETARRTIEALHSCLVK